MSKALNFFKRNYVRWQRRQLIKRDVKKGERKYNALPNKKELSPAQKKEVIDFYKNLTGVEVPLVWHNIYYSKTGNYVKEILPHSLYSFDLLGKANRLDYRDAYADKNMIEVLFPDVKHPKTILRNMNGYYYWGEQLVSKEVAIQNLQNIEACIIKPSMESEGSGVRKLVVENGITNVDGKSVEQLFKLYKKNFLIQEYVQQHERLSALNESSLNSIRIVTYLSQSEVLVLFSSIRIGRKGSVVDNINAGGLSVVVNSDGTLGKYAYLAGSEERREKTDSGVVVDGYQIPFFDKAVELVKESHKRLPFFSLIGWDVSIDRAGNPLMIEWNILPGISQLSYGPAFGQYTERIIKELWPRQNTMFPHLYK